MHHACPWLWGTTLEYSVWARLTFRCHRVRSLIGSPLFYLLTNFVFSNKLFLTFIFARCFSSLFANFVLKWKEAAPDPWTPTSKIFRRKERPTRSEQGCFTRRQKMNLHRGSDKMEKKNPGKKCALTENPGEESLVFFFFARTDYA